MAKFTMRKWRKERKLKGFWGFGIAKSWGGWYIDFGPWCWTNCTDESLLSD